MSSGAHRMPLGARRSYNPKVSGNGNLMAPGRKRVAFTLPSSDGDGDALIGVHGDGDNEGNGNAEPHGNLASSGSNPDRTLTGKHQHTQEDRHRNPRQARNCRQICVPPVREDVQAGLTPSLDEEQNQTEITNARHSALYVRFQNRRQRGAVDETEQERAQDGCGGGKEVGEETGEEGEEEEGG
ncbi:hypothetical protein CF335_g361 [Tilletia laevis]|nr:hypothetical protein CF335_g361 [Tilletia laevis]